MATVSKNIYFNMLDNIANKYNSTVHRTTKMKPSDVTSDSYAEYSKDSNEKIPSLRLVIMSGYQNTKTFLLMDPLKICQKKFLLLAKIKTLLCGIVFLVT